MFSDHTTQRMLADCEGKSASNGVENERQKSPILSKSPSCDGNSHLYSARARQTIDTESNGGRGGAKRILETDETLEDINGESQQEKQR